MEEINDCMKRHVDDDDFSVRQREHQEKCYCAEIQNPRTRKQLAQRAKMKALVETSLYFAPAAELGFPGRKAGNTIYNAFVQANMAADSVNEECELTIDFEKITCASGAYKMGTWLLLSTRRGRRDVYPRRTDPLVRVG